MGALSTAAESTRSDDAPREGDARLGTHLRTTESDAPAHAWFENCRDTVPPLRANGHALRFTE
jgi:hypothetical protein